MKYEIITIIGIVIVAVLIASIMSMYIQNYEYKACSLEKDNQYFYTQEGCYTALNRPLINQVLIFVGVLLLELLSAILGTFLLYMGIIIYREIKENGI